MSILMRPYYLQGIKAQVNKTVHNCVDCIRADGKPLQPNMGQLPKQRVRFSSPFSKCGTDITGPFLLKNGILRTYKTIKAYVINFVCLTTRATHLEVVTDLSTNNFLAALSRISSRRGEVNELIMRKSSRQRN
jgi:hypothetical protein